LAEDSILLATRFPILAAAGLALVLQACATVPPATQESAPTEQKPVPELTLNLPDQSDTDCACDSEEASDHNLLDKGFRALESGDHREAVNYFRRYQRLDPSAGVDWEAEIAVTYDKMFPESPYYNSKAASESYHQLKRQQPEGVEVHEKILMMRDALAILVALHQKIDDQQDENDVLAEDLEKREEALKRLRELTLGQ
jgi:tetratricopeptide (TPR) repeat protein